MSCTIFLYIQLFSKIKFKKNYQLYLNFMRTYSPHHSHVANTCFHTIKCMSQKKSGRTKTTMKPIIYCRNDLDKTKKYENRSYIFSNCMKWNILHTTLKGHNFMLFSNRTSAKSSIIDLNKGNAYQMSEKQHSTRCNQQRINPRTNEQSDPDKAPPAAKEHGHFHNPRVERSSSSSEAPVKYAG
ncbi:hypothetical protein Droror1_Dr00019157 [Drosera rotundifolia]